MPQMWLSRLREGDRESGLACAFADKDKKTQEQGDASGGESADGILPPFVVGESGTAYSLGHKKQTQPPKLYTEGTLLRAMESAGKTVDDEDLREAMKENGIGRPSTRAAIIETLFKRHYIARKEKYHGSSCRNRTDSYHK